MTFLTSCFKKIRFEPMVIDFMMLVSYKAIKNRSESFFLDTSREGSLPSLPNQETYFCDKAMHFQARKPQLDSIESAN